MRYAKIGIAFIAFLRTGSVLANLEVKWLYDVIALEESRSFTLAAKARNISQSSFSRRIQSLEASLGFSIFDRSANPLQLTNRGKIFVGYAAKYAR
ncbi:LysR family transcriptional regulator [Klebsiella pneumoniae]|nr:LysR family transcriptional regulator [Klebsiella pneumoniae]